MIGGLESQCCCWMPR